MKLEFFFGAGTLVFGLLTGGFGACVVGVFFLLLVAVEVMPAWIRRELHLYRAITRHDFDQLGHERIAARPTSARTFRNARPERLASKSRR